MVTRKPKKSVRQRGNRTHGWGAGKKHRGKGHIGGHGASNKGKRGASRKTKYLAKGINPLGKSGMHTIRNRKADKTINIAKISEKLDTWVKQGKVTKEKDMYVVDLAKLGYTKLLGTGKVSAKLSINVAKISESARSKLGIKAE
jgi:large subunit ribosomal protein L15